jgi:hypothetical protein
MYPLLKDSVFQCGVLAIRNALTPTLSRNRERGREKSIRRTQ